MTELLYLQDAYLTRVETEVAGCEPCAEGRGGFEAVPAATILYPEGGGQPSDRGRVGGLEVRRLFRRGDGAVAHVVDRPVSDTVTVELDWERRYDHMRQHTAQHLLTAVADQLHGLKTTAFHLGAARSDIELDADGLEPEQLAGLEARVNELVRARLPVTQRFVDASRLDEMDVRTRGLPEDFAGQVRLVEIEGVDLNTCGGTHVANTAELQAVKLLHQERMRGGTRLHFAAGDRVTRLMEEMLGRERELSALLTCGPDEHAAAAGRMQSAVKSADRRLRRQGEELAALLGADLAREEGTAALHRPDPDMGFLRAAANSAREAKPDILALLTGGEQEGVFLLIGPEPAVVRLGPEVARLLEGRGGGAGGTYQGKAARLDRREEALDLLRSGSRNG